MVGLSSDHSGGGGWSISATMPPQLPRRRLLCALALALLASPATAQRASPSSLRREPSTGEVVAHPHFSARGATLSRPPVVAFYYAWYGNPENDGSYRHWNHAALPHWDAAVNAATFGSADPDAEALAAHVRLEPPQRVHAAFYPERGCYSSVDPNALDAQIEEALAAGIDAFAVSWWGRPEHKGAADSQGVNTDQAVFALVAAAERSIRRRSDPTSDDGDRLDGGLGLAGEGGGMRVAFHLEPYPGRTAETVRADLRYLIDRFGASDALLRGGAERGSGPVFFVYDSYLTAAAEWATLLGPRTDGSSGSSGSSVRGTALDGFFVGLWLTRSDAAQIERGGFDGAYTYFASDASSDASDPSRWRGMAEEARSRRLAFVPCVGPGYNDTKVRPWNARATRGREGGRRYARRWRLALDAAPAAVGVTSWNEWGEGTQIEPAAARPGYAAYDVAEDARADEPGWRAAIREEGAGGADPGGGSSSNGRGEAGTLGARADPGLYLDVTRHFARRLASPGFDGGGAGEVPEDGAARGREEL